MADATRRALVVGLGLIGGSIGIALRRRGWHVTYVDPAVALTEARSRGAADEKLDSIDQSSAGVTILATPVDVALRQIAGELAPGDLVTSVCSVMAPLIAEASKSKLRFVAGHPMAGSEERSVAAARADLFEGKRWFVHAGHDEPLVDDLVRDCGAILDPVDPIEHDRAVAVTSQLPQILSTALAALIEREGDELLRFAGGGLRTFLRLAGSDASVWAPVIAANRENLVREAAALEAVAREIAAGDPRDAFASAQRLWAKLREM
ncbi:MAG TPA: prephenate dehydrogenase/arogenate dehydrogenase family protein [Thermoanaerobaculia bacterium]|nr:prephenate dehydrogenase/arogenate dehydrogenase family protein [Thermoanaerobaculia bacterium]